MKDVIDFDRFRQDHISTDTTDEELSVGALGSLAHHLLAVPELPEDAPREQLFEFAALTGLAGAYGADLLQNPRPYDRIVRAYLDRWHPAG